jgi:peptidyl-tRNA hydrolase, PTH1 family
MVLAQAADRWGVALAQEGDRLQGRGEVGGQQVLLVLPLTWMNQTGYVVRAVLQELNPASLDLIVVYDDLDLPLGSIKIKTRGGAGGHNGLRSVLSCLGTEEFSRVKVGIGRPPENEDLAKFVLSPFPAEEWEQVVPTLQKAVDALECLIDEGPAVAMNRFHVRSSQGGQGGME